MKNKEQIEQAIKSLKRIRYQLGLPDYCNNGEGTWRPNAETKACDTALSALRAQQERENEEYVVEAIGSEAKHIIELLKREQEQIDPKPLTLEQLEKRMGKPVYTVLLDEPGEFIPGNAWWDVFLQTSSIVGMAYFRSGHSRRTDTLGKTWLAYDHEPKEGRS